MSDDLRDQELVARAREGDALAFRRLVDLYQDVVAGVVIRMLGSCDEADDVGQETFLRFHGALASFRGDASVRTYLTRIAVNLSLNELKRRKRSALRFLPWGAGAAEPVSPAGGPEQELEQDERARLLHSALERLDPDHRAVVVLRMLEGRSTRETAEALGIPEGTVLSRLARGLAKLAPHLERLRPS